MLRARSLLSATVSYLLGSVVAGVVYSRLRGDDIRERDLPGGSGTYRQYGRAAALGVTGADIAKGALAAALARRLDPETAWVGAGGVVLGHCYPAYFGGRGGGGIAPLLGALGVLAPRTLLATLALAGAVMPLYRRYGQPRVGLNVIPATTALVLPPAWWLAGRWGGRRALLAGGAVMALRGAHLLRRGRA